MTKKPGWGTKVERERRRRILLSLWAYSYEVHAVSLVSDGVFDAESRAVDLSVRTGDKFLDGWFKQNFDPSTGMWILEHPDLKGIAALYERVTSWGA